MSRLEKAHLPVLGVSWGLLELLRCNAWAGPQLTESNFLSVLSQCQRAGTSALMFFSRHTCLSHLAQPLKSQLLPEAAFQASKCSGTLAYSSELAKGSNCVLNVLVTYVKYESVRFRTEWTNTFWPSSHDSTFQKWNNKPLSSWDLRSRTLYK